MTEDTDEEEETIPAIGMMTDVEIETIDIATAAATTRMRKKIEIDGQSTRHGETLVANVTETKGGAIGVDPEESGR